MISSYFLLHFSRIEKQMQLLLTFNAAFLHATQITQKKTRPFYRGRAFLIGIPFSVGFLQVAQQEDLRALLIADLQYMHIGVPCVLPLEVLNHVSDHHIFHFTI